MCTATEKPHRGDGGMHHGAETHHIHRPVEIGAPEDDAGDDLTRGGGRGDCRYLPDLARDSGGGRGHQGSAFTCVLAGGGLRHCGAYGRTDNLAKTIAADPVSVPDFFATIHAAMGIDYTKNLYDGDRPVPITDMGQPIAALF